jgi:hypothetical protein
MSHLRASVLVLGILCHAAFGADLAASVVVYGGDSGGTGAALASARLGRRTILVSEESWLGGMMTSGGVAVFDGNPLGHSYGLTCGLYGEMRLRLARTYPEHQGDIRKASCYEPHVGARVLDQMAAESPGLRVLRNTRLVGVETSGERVTAIRVEGPGFSGRIRGEVFIDGTDTGLLAARAGVPYRLGTDDSNHIVMAYAVRSTFMRGPDAIVPFRKDPKTGDELPPPHYGLSYARCVEEVPFRWEFWRARGSTPEPPGVFNPYGRLPILDARLAAGNVKWDINCDANDITLDAIAEQLADDPEVGWYFRDADGKPVPARACIPAVEDDPSLAPGVRARILARIGDCVRDSSLSLLYFLRTRVRELGGAQWGLAPEHDTADRLPPKIYQREGRRIVGRYTMTEFDLCPSFTEDYRPGLESKSTSPAKAFPDAIAVGDYAIDVHRIDRARKSDWFPLPPYQVPFGILVPANRSNLLVTTAVSASHLAFGTLRMDPLRMLMGQACGTAAHVALRRQPARTDTVDVRAVQRLLIAQGSMLTYFQDVPYDPVSGGLTLKDLFVPTQVLAIEGVLRGYGDSTFRRHDLLPRAQLASLLAKLTHTPGGTAQPMPDVATDHWAYGDIQAVVARGLLSARPDGRFEPERAATRGEAALGVAIALGLAPDPRAAPPYDDVDPASAVGRAAAALARPCPQDGRPVFGGVAPRLFAPNAPMTRGDAAHLLQRAFLPLDVPRRLVAPAASR